MEVELEHGLHDPATNVTDDDPLLTGKIALAHLNEFPDYYTRLERREEEAKREHGAARGRPRGVSAVRGPRDAVRGHRDDVARNGLGRVMLAGVARARTVARLGAAVAGGLLLAAGGGGCGGTKTVTKTVTVVGTVPNGGATSVSASVAAGARDLQQFAW